MEYRTKGKNALSIVIKSEKNVSVIEKEIYKNFGEDDVKQYNNIILQIISLMKKDKITSKELLGKIKNNNLGWNHTSFDDLKLKREEQDSFIIKPFEIEEGAVSCVKCGSKRTFSYQKQTRSCDEMATTIITCADTKCGFKSMYSG
jgi:DNA-directed RNA polymerase subunit M/transcription elongation factor TFIIS